MDRSFSDALASWTAFFALAGGASATLLGLLFVAVSLRLEIFHRREVEDVRLFAAFTLWTFLFAGAIAGLVLAPHEEPERLAAILFPLTLAGFVVMARMAVVWRRLNPGQPDPSHFDTWEGPAILASMSLSHVGLLIVVLFLTTGNPDALGLLAVIEGWLLGMGTAAAWIMLSHAGTGEKN
jgi:hypothetical protein